MSGCKVLTRICWFDVSETPSKYFGLFASLYAWQINQQVCRRETSDYQLLFIFQSNHCMLTRWCFTISTLANWILLSVKVVCYLLADCTHLSDVSQWVVSIPVAGQWQSRAGRPHLLTDDEEDEWVTEVRQSVAGNVIIHNCFLVTLFRIEMRLLLHKWCKHSALQAGPELRPRWWWHY